MVRRNLSQEILYKRHPPPHPPHPTTDGTGWIIGGWVGRMGRGVAFIQSPEDGAGGGVVYSDHLCMSIWGAKRALNDVLRAPSLLLKYSGARGRASPAAARAALRDRDSALAPGRNRANVTMPQEKTREPVGSRVSSFSIRALPGAVSPYHGVRISVGASQSLPTFGARPISLRAASSSLAKASRAR